jgi:hypothetical protein
MKKKLVKIASVVALLLVIIYFVPVLVARSKARPLYGDFDMGVQCMGGHEIFLRLDEEKAFDNCPGHRDLRSVGRVERTNNSITIHRTHDDVPWCRVDFDGSDHSFTFLTTNSTRDLPQVSNPWRTWLPRFLPEE